MPFSEVKIQEFVGYNLEGALLKVKTHIIELDSFEHVGEVFVMLIFFPEFYDHIVHVNL